MIPPTRPRARIAPALLVLAALAGSVPLPVFGQEGIEVRPTSAAGLPTGGDFASPEEFVEVDGITTHLVALGIE